ncbi:YcaO-like family protein [Nocardiopsis suaedae]|uniref:YcaO-like family protein n=1 Tax=Nocardiopsis suaedae TaxID=3018444 RepID=A0ABT4TK80_9ACTN|nr:YcaO-like family protein [Nocardiopsis suaedae]MDA2804664.1 YcaO-like family protein [Nocardiopsis suaedae]
MAFIDGLLDLLFKDGHRPAEVVYGEPAGPVRVHAEEHPGGAALAVLLWRGRVHLVKYDPPEHGGPRKGGCPGCLAGFVGLQQVPGHTPEPVPGGGAAARGLGPGDERAAAELAGALLGGGSPPGTAAVLDPGTGGVRLCRVPPRTGCARCAPEAPATAARFSSPAEDLAKQGRAPRGPRNPPPTLTADYVGAHTLFKEPLVDLDSPIASAQVSLPLADGTREPAAGRSRSFAQSRLTAVLEGLERYAGFHHRAGEGRIEASLRELGDAAIDPRTLGHHSEEQYRGEGFPFTPLDEDETVPWVEVSPVREGGAPRRLPEAALYWAHRGGGRKAFFHDTSNGFALGQTPEEAALHGILEVVERDAFMLTWYRRLRLPEIGADGALTDLVDRVEVFTGFRVRLFWAALDTGIPVVIALAERASPTGPCRFVSAGAGLHPEPAAESAVMELAGLVTAVCADFRGNADRARELARDFGAVRTLDDHSLLGALPSSAHWFDFLTGSEGPSVGLSELAAGAPENATVRDDLRHVADRLAGAGAEAYVADMTTAELRWRGLVCVRAFVPGFLPMTFGHRYRRMEGLPRLHREQSPFPSLLGSEERPEDIPPHPFS